MSRRRYRIDVDPVACVAHGLCAELLPEAVTLDDWGYPILASGPLPEAVLAHARAAASACPTLALRLERVTEPHAARDRSTGTSPTIVPSPPDRQPSLLRAPDSRAARSAR